MQYLLILVFYLYSQNNEQYLTELNVYRTNNQIFTPLPLNSL